MIGHNRIIVPLAGLQGTHPDLIGHRASRLSLASRHGLHIPHGVVITPRALSSFDSDADVDNAETVDALDEIFDSMGRNGRVPLVASMSRIGPDRATAIPSPVPAGITTRADLLHTVRRLSASASMLEEHVALVVQRDVEPLHRPHLTLDSSTPRRHRRAVLRDLPISCRSRRRLAALCDRTVLTFSGTVATDWGIDRADDVWLLDVSPVPTL